MIIFSKVLEQHYKIIKPLAEGGFAFTYLVQDLGNADNQYVLKFLKVSSSDSSNQLKYEDLKKMVEREVAMLKLFSDEPQIPNFINLLEDNQGFYLIQEYIEGNLLSDALKTQVSEDYIKILIREILEIVDKLHCKNIIHRDIKPSNLIRRKTGELVLIDFGSSKKMTYENLQHKLHTRVYTPGYAPLEQLNGNPQLNSDIYAVGMIAIQILTSLEPHQLTLDSLGKVCWDSQIDISAQLRKIIDKMTESNYNDRYKNTQDVIQALRKINISKQSTHQKPPNILEAASKVSNTVIQTPSTIQQRTQKNSTLNQSIFNRIEQILWFLLIIFSISLLIIHSRIIERYKKNKKEAMTIELSYPIDCHLTQPTSIDQ